MSLEPDSVEFMENLITRDRAEAGLQNGFSPTSSVVNDHQTRAEDVKASAPSQLICPVGLHKAVLMYPPSAQTSSPFCSVVLTASCIQLKYQALLLVKLQFYKVVV